MTERPVSAAAWAALATLRTGTSAACEGLAVDGPADGLPEAVADVAAARCDLVATRLDVVRALAARDGSLGLAAGASVAVELGRLGCLPGDRVGLGRDGMMLLVADGFGDGLRDGLGDGVVLLAADGVGDGVPLGVAEGVGAASAVGEALGVADGDEAGAEADGEGLGSADALIGRITAAPAVRTPTTARTAVRAPTSIRPPRFATRTDNTSNH